MKIRLIADLEYDADLMHGNTEHGLQWFHNEVLLGADSTLTLVSGLIGDEVGAITVRSATAIPKEVPG